MTDTGNETGFEFVRFVRSLRHRLDILDLNGETANSDLHRAADSFLLAEDQFLAVLDITTYHHILINIYGVQGL